MFYRHTNCPQEDARVKNVQILQYFLSVETKNMIFDVVIFFKMYMFTKNIC